MDIYFGKLNSLINTIRGKRKILNLTVFTKSKDKAATLDLEMNNVLFSNDKYFDHFFLWNNILYLKIHHYSGYYYK